MPVLVKSVHEEQIELLLATAGVVADAVDLNEMLRGILQLLSEKRKLDRGTITLLDEKTGMLSISVAHGLSPKAQELGRYRVGEGITGRVVQNGRSVIIPDIRQDSRFLNRTGARNIKSDRQVAFLCVPIKSEGHTIGALSVDKEHEGGAHSLDDDLRILKIMIPMVAQAIKLNRRVEQDRRVLRDENLRLKQDLKGKFNIQNMVGNSNAMQEVYRLIEQVADSPSTVLIRGESGTGKELVANGIHYASPRASKPLIKVNCNAFPETLLESELFGHEKGAFTGALERKIGRFEWADGGTLFLDEIGDFPINLQVKLLRVLQTREFERLGGRETIKVDVRIIAATHKNLEEAIQQRTFREDLYYRINVFPIYLPPLRERKDDIMLLADHFLEAYAKLNHKKIVRISTPAIEMLTSYHWPGNVRELENCLERAVLVCDNEVIRSEHLPPSLRMAGNESALTAGSLVEIVGNKERELIIDALKRNRGFQKRAAAELGLTERIFNYRLRKYAIEPRMYKGNKKTVTNE
ncbi:MAG: sigma 54-interacting transcriptional regulator [Candidatus Firestonebacteria bacterium]|nr:sigma 54-interacting transcriptional regulator [Candidatus Firestonebacteria bacterium]